MSTFISQLPLINSCLNGLAAVLLVMGTYVIKAQKNEALHKKLMMSAFFTSALFLVLYLIYHYTVGHVSFGGTGTIKVIYLVILATHIVLAVAVLPFILLAIKHALADNREKHKKMVHIALPIWLYVSVTGVVIYVMVWHLYPATALV